MANKLPKSDVKKPKKVYGSNTFKTIVGIAACLIGGFLTVLAPFTFWNLCFLVVLYRGYEYLERQRKKEIGLVCSIIGFLLGFLTYVF